MGPLIAEALKTLINTNTARTQQALSTPPALWLERLGAAPFPTPTEDPQCVLSQEETFLGTCWTTGPRGYTILGHVRDSIFLMARDCFPLN